MEICEKYNIPLIFVGTGKYIIDGFCPDFINEDKKIIVEIFGDYWHCQPDIRARDRWRFITYKRHGWRSVMLWASELDDEDRVIHKLSSVLDNLK